MPLQATSGAASYDAFGGGVPFEPVYIEQIFQTWLYTGNGSTQTITNGIDLAGKGGLIWMKSRSAATNHFLNDTARSSSNYSYLSSNTTAAESILSGVGYLSNGFTLPNLAGINTSAATYTSWTFRKQPKFFDCVTWTGDGVAGRQISHALDSVPGCVIVKRTDSTGSWAVWHRGLSAGNWLKLNLTDAQASQTTIFPSDPTSTTFTVGLSTLVNASGGTYVAYLFAHNAGGFGLTGADNVISCGSYTGTGSTQQQITLGYEPQWVMIKRTDTANSWIMVDNMRGFFQAADNALCANNANAEAATVSVSGAMQPTATGFSLFNANSAVNASGGTYIYIAIRRGPMKTPTSGTQVFAPRTYTGVSGGATATITAGFPIDMVLARTRNNSDIGSGNSSNALMTRLTRISTTNNYAAATSALFTPGTDAEITTLNGVGNFNNTGFTVDGNSGGLSSPSGEPFIAECFRRAPGFFDVVCYTGTGVARTVAHSLTVPPELIIVKARDTSLYDWPVYAAPQGNTQRGFLNLTNVFATGSVSLWDNTSPTSSVFTVSGAGTVNASGTTYVAYLFASCPGVQSIQSYVGDGTTGRTINCGFTGGARFVCIKATSTTGSWWTFDSARGIVTNNDPALQLNSTAAEVTSADAVDTAASGFIVNQEATCSLNASGVTYLVWAIA